MKKRLSFNCEDIIWFCGLILKYKILTSKSKMRLRSFLFWIDAQMPLNYFFQRWWRTLLWTWNPSSTSYRNTMWLTSGNRPSQLSFDQLINQKFNLMPSLLINIRVSVFSVIAVKMVKYTFKTVMVVFNCSTWKYNHFLALLKTKNIFQETKITRIYFFNTHVW